MIVTIDRVISRSDENAGASPRNKFMPQYSWDGGRELSANDDRMPQAYLDFSARRHPGARTDHYVGTGTEAFRRSGHQSKEGTGIPPSPTCCAIFVQHPCPPLKSASTPPGDQAQVDFAQFQLQFTDEPTITRIVWLFSFVLGFSRLTLARFVLHQDMQT